MSSRFQNSGMKSGLASNHKTEAKRYDDLKQKGAAWGSITDDIQKQKDLKSELCNSVTYPIKSALEWGAQIDAGICTPDIQLPTPSAESKCAQEMKYIFTAATTSAKFTAPAGYTLADETGFVGKAAGNYIQYTNLSQWYLYIVTFIVYGNRITLKKEAYSASNPTPPAGPDYLCIELTARPGSMSETPQVSFGIYGDSEFPAVSDPVVYYSTDKVTWTQMSTEQDAETKIPFLNVGHKVYFKGNNNSLCGWHFFDYGDYVDDGLKFKVSGNAMTLIKDDGTQTNFADGTTGNFAYLFADFVHLDDASELELPATEVKDDGYFGMFEHDLRLTKAPELPAMTIGTYCYSYMFWETAITVAPDLPAPTLKQGCYSAMFMGTWALTTAMDELPATTPAPECYDSMFATDDNLSEYYLTKAPEIKLSSFAANNSENALAEMFLNQASLNEIKIHYAGYFDDTFSDDWVKGVANGGNFHYNGPDRTHAAYAIPSGWTINSFNGQTNPADAEE